jgi:hypothetical protein
VLALFRGAARAGRLHSLACSAAAVALASVLTPGLALAQTAPASAETLRQMRQELDALRAEEAAAKAAEQARARRIDALAQQLARASGEPVVETAPPPTEVAQTAPGPKRDDGRKFEIYGFAQADYVQDFKRVNNAWDDTLRPSRIPTTEGQFGSNGQAIISVRQSRFGVQASMPVWGEELYAKFEFDAFGTGADEGKTTFRLRHAFGRWGPLLAGQTNTVFMDIDTFPNVVDYWGPAGMVFVRTPQVRYTWKTGPHEIAVALEKPSNDIDPGNIRLIDPDLASSIQPDEKIPDFTAHWRYDGDFGHVQLAGIVRKVAFDSAGTVDNRPKNSKVGWGVNLASNIKFGAKDVLHLSAVYGEGIATYMNDGGMDLGPKGQPVILSNGQITGLSPDVVPLLGLMAYYDHYWTNELSTSIGWSETRVDNLSFQAADAFRSGQYASVNLLWAPDPRILMGGEFLWGQRKDNDGSHGDDTRLQFSFKYSFSSNDFR